MVVSARGEPIRTRIDHDQTRAAAHEVDDRVPEKPIRIRRQRLLAPYHDALRHLVLRVIVAPGQPSRIVYLGVCRPEQVRRSRHAGHVARVPRLRIAIVRRAEHPAPERCHGAALAPGAREAHDGLAPVLLRDAIVFALNEGERLIPADLLPRIRVAALLGVSLHGMQDAARVVDVILQGEAANAQAPLRHRVVLIPFHLDELPILVSVELQRAPDRVASWRRPRARARDRQAILFEAPGLVEVIHVRNGALAPGVQSLWVPAAHGRIVMPIRILLLHLRSPPSFAHLIPSHCVHHGR